MQLCITDAFASSCAELPSDGLNALLIHNGMGASWSKILVGPLAPASAQLNEFQYALSSSCSYVTAFMT